MADAEQITTHVGTWKSLALMLPWAMSASVMMPIVFCAWFGPGRQREERAGDELAEPVAARHHAGTLAPDHPIGDQDRDPGDGEGQRRGDQRGDHDLLQDAAALDGPGAAGDEDRAD